jgi:hypothetical protein
MNRKQSKKTSKSETGAPALMVNCTDADKLVKAARKHLRLIKTEQRQARKALKQAKKARKRARKASSRTKK